MTREFANFAVIDWSGQAVARPTGLAVAHAVPGRRSPSILCPADGWSRDAILVWLRDHAAAGTDLLIGMDLSPALPFADCGAYFPEWERSPTSAKELWALVDSLSADTPHLGAAGFLADPVAREHFRHQDYCGNRFGTGRGRLRACEHGQAAMGLNPSSCMNLIGAAQVGKSSLTGMRVLHRLDGAIPVWPFDPLPAAGPVIVEIYTSLAARAAGIRRGRSKLRDGEALDSALDHLGCDHHRPLDCYNDHLTDAILTTAWLRTASNQSELWAPRAMTREIASTEGWTFGVP